MTRAFIPQADLMFPIVHTYFEYPFVMSHAVVVFAQSLPCLVDKRPDQLIVTQCQRADLRAFQ